MHRSVSAAEHRPARDYNGVSTSASTGLHRRAAVLNSFEKKKGNLPTAFIMEPIDMVVSRLHRADMMYFAWSSSLGREHTFFDYRRSARKEGRTPNAEIDRSTTSGGFTVSSDAGQKL